MMLVAVSIIIGLIGYMITALGVGAMFGKAGEAKWKAWVPVYNTYVYTKISWSAKMFWVMFIIGCVSGIVQQIGQSSTSLICAILSVILSIVLVVMVAILCSKTSKAFGHRGGYAVGLFFLPVIFQLIIGFGQSEYVGTQG